MFEHYQQHWNANPLHFPTDLAEHHTFVIFIISAFPKVFLDAEDRILCGKPKIKPCMMPQAAKGTGYRRNGKQQACEPCRKVR
jgi:hypothetical protein